MICKKERKKKNSGLDGSHGSACTKKNIEEKIITSFSRWIAINIFGTSLNE
jgi:hypothetical protein